MFLWVTWNLPAHKYNKSVANRELCLQEDSVTCKTKALWETGGLGDSRKN
jgi:hypothetical protein